MEEIESRIPIESSRSNYMYTPLENQARRSICWWGVYEEGPVLSDSRPPMSAPYALPRVSGTDPFPTVM